MQMKVKPRVTKAKPKQSSTLGNQWKYAAYGNAISKTNAETTPTSGSEEQENTYTKNTYTTILNEIYNISLALKNYCIAENISHYQVDTHS